MKRQMQISHKKAVTLVLVAAFICYFLSEAVLRQFVLHRAGVQSISLDSLLSKLPPGVRDEVSRRVTIAELRDKLRDAKTTSEKIRISITLGGVISEKKLQETYAEVLDKYPSEPEALPAYINYLLAPDTALKSVSIEQLQQFIKKLKEPEQYFAWNAGFSKLKTLKASNQQQIAFLRPILDMKPAYREYQQLYVDLSELAFRQEDKDIEMKARKLEEDCLKLDYFDPALAKKQKKSGK